MGCSVHSELLKTELIDVLRMSNTYKKLERSQTNTDFFLSVFLLTKEDINKSRHFEPGTGLIHHHLKSDYSGYVCLLYTVSGFL